MKKNGLTLLEVLVTIIIFSALMLGMGGLFISGKQLVRHSRYRMTAAELLKYFMEPLQMHVSEYNRNQSLGFYSGRVPSDSFIPDLKENYSAIYTVNKDYPLSGLTKVKVNVTWQEEDFTNQ